LAAPMVEQTAEHSGANWAALTVEHSAACLAALMVSRRAVEWGSRTVATKGAKKAEYSAARSVGLRGVPTE